MLDDLNLGNLQSLLTALNQIPDFRVHNQSFKHELGNVLLIMILSVMSNFTSQRNMEEFTRNHADILKEKLELKVLPTRSLFNRVSVNVKPQDLVSSLDQWLGNILDKFGIKPEKAAIDGKFLQGTIDLKTHNTLEQNMVSIVSAYEHELGLILHQQDMEGKKESETQVLRDTARNLNADTVTADALHCNRETVKLFQELNLNYVLGLKGNNRLLKEQLLAQSSLVETFSYTDKKFMREARTLRVPDNFMVIKSYTPRNYINPKTKHASIVKPVYKAWKDLNFKTLVEIKRTNLKSGKIQINYYITNLTQSASELAKTIQDHWSIENKLHREKDMVFLEDKHKTKHHNSAKVLSGLIHTVINIFRLHGYQSMQKATQKYCNRVAQCLDLIQLKNVDYLLNVANRRVKKM